ncbi:unnamed protein product [Prorocentrum cordatum]|uniref:Pentatricopeptide repeat-containing protein, chloroplastic n=1 Tax=Prorocentrum cordatum TaxID=2364126 RepID=A0ABN9T2K0_9DINO|nr:unnamed protein product [Polarella glacialis]
MGVCLQGRRWREVLGLLRGATLARVSPDVVTFGAAMGACAQGRHWELVVGLAGELRGLGLRANAVVHSTLLLALDRGTHWTSALEVAEEMLGSSPCGSSSESAWDTRPRRPPPAGGLPGAAPTNTAYNASLTVLGRRRQWARALHVAGAMRRSRGLPDRITYSLLMSALEKEHQWQRAIGLLSEMRWCALHVTSVGLAAALGACRRGLRWALALAALADVRGAMPPDAPSYIPRGSEAVSARPSPWRERGAPGGDEPALAAAVGDLLAAAGAPLGAAEGGQRAFDRQVRQPFLFIRGIAISIPEPLPRILASYASLALGGRAAAAGPPARPSGAAVGGAGAPRAAAGCVRC